MGGACVFVVVEGVHHAPALKAAFTDDVFLALKPLYDGDDKNRFAAREKRSLEMGIRLVAMGHVIMHAGRRRRLADVLSCIREKVKIDQLGRLAQPNAEARLKSEFEMRRLFQGYSEALANTQVIAERCPFSLDELQYEYPDEVTDGEDADARLRRLTEDGLNWRYPDRLTPRVQAMVAKELKLIAELNYAPVFSDSLRHCCLCAQSEYFVSGQGQRGQFRRLLRLGITEASPETISMVFERFISDVRGEPPDIDVDFEHERAKKSFSIFIKNMAATAQGYVRPLSIFAAVPR